MILAAGVPGRSLSVAVIITACVLFLVVSASDIT